jgi:hypothetical protein
VNGAVSLTEQSYAKQIASSFSSRLLGPELAEDVIQSIRAALDAGVVFGKINDPETILNSAVSTAITNIEERASQLRRFLLDGPYEREGDIPPELQGQRLTDEETSKAITFIYSHVVNCFQGSLAELLAAKPCARLVQDLKKNGLLPASSQLYLGDTVLFSTKSDKLFRKAADMHIILIDDKSPSKAVINGVVEVKSYHCSSSRLKSQLAKHIARVRKGSRIWITTGNNPAEYTGECPGNVLKVTITPATWKLSRKFSYVQEDGKSFWHTDTTTPPFDDHLVNRAGGPNDWRIVLRWSKEALAAAAYEMTYWYMEKLGEAIFSEKLPSTWSQMTPAGAGRNAAKMMLYYAIPRSLNYRGEQRAIALYNTYCFGYALGMNFRDGEGHREMLWSDDLHEITSEGSTKHGCTISSC